MSAREIQSTFQVSFDTARRDLRILEEQGLLRRTHGGALPITERKENTKSKPMDTEKLKVYDEHIEAIVLKATSVIKDKDVIFINDPTYSEIFIRNLNKDITLTVVTNSIIVAEQFRKLNNVQLFLHGGEIDSYGNCLSIFTFDIIKKMRFDKSFITSTSISSKFGLSMQNNHNINFLNAIIDSSREAIGLYPSEKVGFESILNICPANKLNVLITNNDAPSSEIEDLNRQGIKVLLADAPVEV